MTLTAGTADIMGPRRPDHPRLHLPVAQGRQQHLRSNKQHLHADLVRLRRDHPGKGGFHRRPRATPSRLPATRRSRSRRSPPPVPPTRGRSGAAHSPWGHSLHSNGDPSGSGFESRSGHTAFGNLSGATFTHLGVNYTVTTVWGGGLNDLVLATTPNLPLDGAGLTLHVQTYGGELDLPLTDASFDNSSYWFFRCCADCPTVRPPLGCSADSHLRN